VPGCAGLRGRLRGAVTGAPPAFDEDAYVRKPIPTFRVPTATLGDGVMIGGVRHHRIRDGETLFDVARWYDLGYNEIVEANPTVDPLIPPVGTEVVLPTEWVLPCCTYDGIVVNIPEMRLYHFRRDSHDPRTTLVTTYPVGLGRNGWRTPRGTFRVHAKTVDPRWDIPEAIRREHIRERGDPRRFIAGGDPDNPLGHYRIQLSRRLYSIHGTDIPWGIGMQVTHGCVRLYPEDIERLFPLVPVGEPVEFTYQPVKVGRRDGAVYVEVQRDIYHYVQSAPAAAATALARRGLARGVDGGLLRAALASPSGLPVRVSADHALARDGSR
jgi:L,D-transpeptidase ErfK/SrfK